MRVSSSLWILSILTCSCFFRSPGGESAPEGYTRPNIIVFYVDDLGFGDLSSYGAKGVQTPNVDRLALNGIRFTDAHSSAATCTPSRYSLLTGEYAFRNNAEILPGDAPLLIDTSKFTLPKMLKKVGYTNGVIGKWHLGLGSGEVDWNGKVSPGPLEIGFDYSFLLPATGDRVPTVYLENYEVLNLDKNDPITVSYNKDLGQVRATPENARYVSDKQHSETLINGVGRIGAMIGGKQAWWKDEEFPDVFTQKAYSFIEANKDNPFFLYFSFHDIHVPRLPNERFIGKSKMGPRGDAIVQMDWITGQIINQLKSLGLEENTLIIFTSDNGPVLDDGYADFAVEKLGDHQPGGPYRGGKYSSFEGGTRVPFITYWKGHIQAGVSKALISQVDIMASIASLLGIKLEENEAADSEDLLPALMGQSPEGRQYLLEESYRLALRKGPWKYIEPLPDGVELKPWLLKKNVDLGAHDIPQLFNLDKDQSEGINVANDYPGIVQKMKEKLASIRQGSNQSNGSIVNE
ncbi:arylsulfatase [Marinoscillum sp. MHG1-6]|uniref:sulfatase family protein n=1 Tax=Marinoscillum sp. MHG1-6 TaxID=2959627 RepID=UPI0021582DAF|nr:arylsulfatase [Marinoscillum sp. MHG1-6]